MEGKNPEKCVSDIIFGGRWLFMGVMSIQKYSIHTFQRQIVKNGHISTDNESNDKVVYLKEMKEAAKKSEKGSTPLGAFSKQRSQLAIVFCDVRS